MYYPVYGMVHIKQPLLIGKSRPCGNSRFPFLLSERSFTICLMPSCSLNDMEREQQKDTSSQLHELTVDLDVLTAMRLKPESCSLPTMLMWTSEFVRDCLLFPVCTSTWYLTTEGRKKMFHLTTHSTHFIYSYMASDKWKREREKCFI